MHDAFADSDPLVLVERDCLAFEIDVERAFEDEEELVVVVVFVPVKLPFEVPDPHDALIDLSQGPVPPGMVDALQQRGQIDQFLVAVEGLGLDVVLGHFAMMNDLG